MKHFSPPPSKPTFFRWVNEGKIKKARDLQGYYLLNATLTHQGMPSVDTKAYLDRIKDTPKALRTRQLLYLAVLNEFPDFKETDPALFKVPEELSTGELTMIEHMQESYRASRKGTTPDEEAYYTNGFIDALAMIEILERDDLLDKLK